MKRVVKYVGLEKYGGILSTNSFSLFYSDGVVEKAIVTLLL